MDFKFKYKELESLYRAIERNYIAQTKILNNIEHAARQISVSDSIEGSAANSIKSYYRTTYSTIITMMKMLIRAHAENSLVYIRYFDAFNLAGNTEVDSKVFEILSDWLGTSIDKVFDIDKEHIRIEKTVKDMPDVPTIPSAFSVTGKQAQMTNHMKQIKSDVETIESQNKDEFELTRLLITKLNSLINLRISDAKSISDFENFWDSDEGMSYKAFFDKFKNLDGREMKEKYIEQYERSHPEAKALLDDFLNSRSAKGLSDEDKRNIKYLLYTAPEPYKTLYLKNLGNFEFKTTNLDDTAFYDQHNGKISLDPPYNGYLSDKPLYTTLFHECGHAIDDLADESLEKGFDTERYTYYSESAGRNMTLRQAIEYDVFHNRDNPHSMINITNNIIHTDPAASDGAPQRVIKALQTGDKSNLTEDDRVLYERTIEEFQSQFTPNGNHESVTDIYGGVSKNQLIKDDHNTNIGYYHKDSYWNEGGHPERELWADYASNHIAYNPSTIQITQEYFPEASKVMDSYAADLAK